MLYSKFRKILCQVSDRASQIKKEQNMSQINSGSRGGLPVLLLAIQANHWELILRGMFSEDYNIGSISESLSCNFSLSVCFLFVLFLP